MNLNLTENFMPSFITGNRNSNSRAINSWHLMMHIIPTLFLQSRLVVAGAVPWQVVEHVYLLELADMSQMFITL